MKDLSMDELSVSNVSVVQKDVLLLTFFLVLEQITRGQGKLFLTSGLGPGVVTPVMVTYWSV